jgi:hypothetical protein
MKRPSLFLLLAMALLPGAALAEGPDIFHGFEASPTEGGFYGIQSKDRDRGGDGRVTLVPNAREGKHALKLTTLVGDDFVHGSNKWERVDIATSPEAVGGKPGRSWWWANSIYLPEDFHLPRGYDEGYLLMDWHDDCSMRRVPVARGQAPFNLIIATYNGRPSMQVRAYGGDPNDRSGQEQRVVVDPGPQKNVWYDFVHEVRWASDSSGSYRMWMRKGDEATYKLVFERINRPNMWAGCEVYLKLANYHGPYGVPTSVLHDRIVRGKRPQDVALAPLEGVPESARLARRKP